jgi:FtsZ-binding cell division protein ZapB
VGKNRTRDEKQTDEKLLEEESMFPDQLPEEVLRELTPDIRRQYFLWDEILKREVELYPWLILPLIEENFHKKYRKNTRLQLLSTEYTVSRIHKKGVKLLHSIRADLLLRIGMDLYHFECQMKADKTMALRMLEYDTHVALVHGAGKNRLTFPKSVVLYLSHSKNMPDYEQCTLHFQDGSSHLYQVPVMKVQSYSLHRIAEKHLNILIPFLPIRFMRRIRTGKGKSRKRLKEDLTEFLAECIMILNHEKESGVLTENAQNDIAEFLYKACEHLLADEPELLGEVFEAMEPAIKLNREIIKELQDDKKELQNEKKELQNEKNELWHDKEQLQQDKIQLSRQLQIKDKKLEKGIVNLIQRIKNEGKTPADAECALEDVFSLDKKEAKDKVMLYWEKK